ncbi:FxLYD domain-containing protein [Streptomyces sp. CBMA156]|uniref:FxLYD domain-containing protein n=1 Tax=Streptomyces sp. CBMA156 TaxID=1930280 RepID=UPI001661AB7E|nr:FxLYD domain-containing protein [Streptomyces sp. CBMA156]
MDRQPLTRASSPTPPRATAQDLDAPPVRSRRRVAAGVVALAVFGAAVLAGCSSGKSASTVASEAAAAVEKGASAAASAASALATAAGGAGAAIASAEAKASAAVSAASSAVAGIKGGLDAKGDVTAGAVTTGSDGKAQVPLTVTNHGQQSYRYVIQLNFTDESGKVLDATAVTVQDVAAGQSAQATAHGNRELTGTVKAEVANAVRY